MSTDGQARDEGAVARPPGAPDRTAQPRDEPFGKWTPLVPLLAVLGMTVALFWRPLILGEAFFRADLAAAYLPAQLDNARQRAEGTVPLWNRHLLFGYPLTAEVEVGGLYPPALLFNLPLPPERAFAFFIVGHFLVGALSMMFLARELALSRIAQGIAALTFAFGGMSVAQTVNLPIVSTWAWTPLILGLQHRAVVRRSLRAAMVGGLVFGGSLVGAHPQMAFYSLLLGCLIVVFPPGRGTYLQRAGWAAAGFGTMVAVGLAVASPQLAHTLAWLPEIYGLRGSYDFLTSLSHPPHYFLQLLIPNLFGSERNYVGTTNFYEQHAYLGLLTLGLAGRGWRSAPRWCQVALVGGVVLALGRFAGAYHVLEHVPGFDLFRCPVRALFCSNLAASILAARGYDALAARATRGARRTRAGVLAYLGLAFVLATVGLALARTSSPDGLVARWYDRFTLLGAETPVDHPRHRDDFPQMLLRAALDAGWSSLWGFAIAMVSALWWWGVHHRGAGRMAAGAVLVLLAVDLWRASSDIHRYRRATFYRDIPRRYAFYRRQQGLFRVYPTGGPLHTNVGALFEVDVVGGFPSRPLPALGAFNYLPPRMTLAKLAAGNVKYVEAETPAGVPVQGLVKRRRFGGLAVYENLRVLPRAYLRERVRVLPDPTAVSRWVNSGKFDPWSEVVLEAAPPFAPERCPPRQDVPSSVSVTRYSPSDVVILAHAPQCALLVLADMYFPGWTATVDGGPATILRANGLFRAVALSPGAHTVEFRFAPAHFTAASAASALTLLLVLTFVLAGHGAGSPRER